MSQTSDAYTEARRRVAEAKATGNTELELSIWGLATIPPELSALATLRSLYLMGTEVNDIAPVSTLTALKRLNIEGTKVTDLSPLRTLTSLQQLYLMDTRVSNLAPLASLTALEDLDLDSSEVKDLRSIRHFTALREAAGLSSDGLQFRDTPATRLDPELDRLSEIDDAETRTRETLAYLNALDDAAYDRLLGLPPTDPAPTPEQDTALPVTVAEGKAEVAPALPVGAELTDPVKRKALERLREAVEVLRRSGNQHPDIDTISRRLAAELAHDFPAIDLMEVHFDLTACRSIFTRRDEREGDDRLAPETVTALDRVWMIGPGLTLDNPEVEVFEARYRRHAQATDTTAPIAAQDELSRAIITAPDAFGPRIISYSATFTQSSTDPETRVRVAQQTVNRNIVIALGRYVAPVALNALIGHETISFAGWLWANHSVITTLAQYWGDGFAAWIGPILDYARDRVQPGPKRD